MRNFYVERKDKETDTRYQKRCYKVFDLWRKKNKKDVTVDTMVEWDTTCNSKQMLGDDEKELAYLGRKHRAHIILTLVWVDLIPVPGFTDDKGNAKAITVQKFLRDGSSYKPRQHLTNKYLQNVQSEIDPWVKAKLARLKIYYAGRVTSQQVAEATQEAFEKYGYILDSAKVEEEESALVCD